MKRLKNQQENENIVHAERFLDQITGKEFHAHLRPLRIVEPQIEKQRHGNPRRALQQSLAQADRMVFAMEYAQVNQQGRGRGDGEDYPDVYWRSQHRDMSALRWCTSLTVRPPRTKADIAHFQHLIVAGFARMHDNSPL